MKKISWGLFLSGLIALSVSISIPAIIVTYFCQLVDLDNMLAEGHYRCMIILVCAIFLTAYLLGMIIYRIQRTQPTHMIANTTTLLIFYPLVWYAIIFFIRFQFPQVGYMTLYFVHNPITALCGMYHAMSGSLMLDCCLEILSTAAISLGIISFSKLKKTPFVVGFVLQVILVAGLLFAMHYIYINYALIF